MKVRLKHPSLDHTGFNILYLAALESLGFQFQMHRDPLYPVPFSVAVHQIIELPDSVTIESVSSTLDIFLDLRLFISAEDGITLSIEDDWSLNDAN